MFGSAPTDGDHLGVGRHGGPRGEARGGNGVRGATRRGMRAEGGGDPDGDKFRIPSRDHELEQ